MQSRTLFQLNHANAKIHFNLNKPNVQKNEMLLYCVLSSRNKCVAAALLHIWLSFFMKQVWKSSFT